jgi:hypothetical protein
MSGASVCAKPAVYGEVAVHRESLKGDWAFVGKKRYFVFD